MHRKRSGLAAGRALAALATALMLCAAPAATSLGAGTNQNAVLKDKAFESAQWVMATAAARAVSQVGARIAAGSGELGETVRRRQELEDRFQRARNRLVEVLKSGEGDSEAIKADIAGTERALAAIDADIAKRFPDYAEVANPRPLGIAEVQSLLSDGEALVLFLADRAATYVWAVSKTGSQWNRADVGREAMDNAVRTLRLTLDPNAPSRGAESLSEEENEGGAGFDRELAFDLYSRLIAPVARTLDGASHVFVVADGPLTSLPLSVLVTEAPQGADNDPQALRDTAWLVRKFATTTLPAVTSLRAIRSGNAAAASGSISFRGFGAPALTGPGGAEAEPAKIASRGVSSFFSGRYADVDAVRQLNPLPGTARELTRIATLLNAGDKAISLGDEATETAVKHADFSGVSVLAFATHGLVTGELTGLAEPALVFTPPPRATPEDDGLLTASEASALKIDADWVILSACNTAAGDGSPGAEGLSGLARAFLFAGARAILVSHWPVRDDAAAKLTVGTLERLRDHPGMARSEALRESMVALIADDSDPSLAHPSAWAPFVVVGEGGIRPAGQ
ncbi:MAG: CHAT domain-containing protein [Flavobacteriaceae bacterium]